MKRNIKIITMIALTFSILGCLLIGVGVASGGVNELKAQTNAGLHSFTQDKKVIKGDITALEANLEDMSLTIVPSEDEHFYLGYNISSTNKAMLFTYYVTDDKVLTLKNEMPKKSRFDQYTLNRLSLNLLSVFLNDDTMLADDTENGTVFLYVPEYALKNSTIEMTYGDLQLNNCRLDAVEAHLEYGDLVLAKPQWQDARFHVEYGDVDGHEFKCSNNTRLDLGYGDATFEKSKLEFTVNLDFKSDMGDIEVNSAFGGEHSTADADSVYYKRQGQFSGPLLAINAEYGDITFN